MNKKKDIIVWDQFDKVKSIESNSEKNKESIPAYTRNYEEDDRNNVLNITSKIKTFKPIMIAIFSALLIGSVLGFMMLNLLTQLNDDSDHLEPEVSKTAVSNEQKLSNSEEIQKFTLKSMSGQVIQVGVFSKTENANEWIETYKQAGFPTTLWERDGQYFLFAGIAETKEDANKLRTNITSNDFDAFIKEWQTKEYEIELLPVDYEWLTAFQELWHETLHSVSVQEGINTNNWHNLIEQADKKSEKVINLSEEIQSLINHDFKEDTLLEQKVLLEVWQKFEKNFSQ